MSPTSDTHVSLLALCGMPHYTNLLRQDEDFWNLLEVRWDRALNDLRNQSYVLRQLQRLESAFVRELVDWAEVETAFSDTTNLAEIIFGQIDQVWVETIFLLMEFCENRRYDSFRTATQELLTEDQFKLIDGRFNSMPSNRLLLALKVFCDDPTKLKFLILWDHVDNRSYQRYSLVPTILGQTSNDDNGDELSALDLEQKIKDGIDLALITRV